MTHPHTHPQIHIPPNPPTNTHTPTPYTHTSTPPHPHTYCYYSYNSTTSIYKLDSFTIPTVTTIDKLLQTVKSSCKLDPIPTTLLHKLSTHLTQYYNNIIDRSLTLGIVPSSMKLEHVTPIIKNLSLDKSDLSNYRPISNLSYISKTLERVVCSQLLNYLDRHKFIK